MKVVLTSFNEFRDLKKKQKIQKYVHKYPENKNFIPYLRMISLFLKIMLENKIRQVNSFLKKEKKINLFKNNQEYDPHFYSSLNRIQFWENFDESSASRTTTTTTTGVNSGSHVRFDLQWKDLRWLACKTELYRWYQQT